MIKETTLKNCPFCDGKPKLSLEDGAYYCKDCGCMPYVNEFQTPDEAWNQRVEPFPQWLREKIEDKKIEWAIPGIGAWYFRNALDWVLSMKRDES